MYALGIGLIFGVMQLINFAHGELVMVGGYALVVSAGLFLPLQALITIVLAIAFALAMERTAFRPLRSAEPATLLVASFAVSVILQSAAELIFTALPRGVNVSSTLTRSLTIESIVIPWLSVITIGVIAVFLAGLTLFLKRAPLGVQMRAAAENFPMARLLGVRANRVIATAFALSGLLAGIGAFLVVAQTGTVGPVMGVNVVVVAFVATILGGMGSLVGSVLGGLILGSATVALQASLPYELLPFRDAFVFSLVFLMLIFRPQGLVVAKSRIGRV